MNQLNSKPKRKALINESWYRGELKWILHGVQRELYDAFKDSEKNSISVWLCSRQLGKSFCLTVLAIEEALKNKNSIIKLVTDTKQHVKSIFEPLFKQVLEKCPVELQPKYNTSQFLYMFPNGSQIQLAGSDNKHYEKLRGQRCSLILVDEAGFCNDLADMIYSVLLPTTTHTGGKIVLASTPPEDQSHPFLLFIEQAEQTNSLIKKTIYDNPLLSKEQIQNIIDKMGGVNAERFRREYLCELIKSAERSVIPEFDDDLIKEIVKEWPIPPFYDAYDAMDIGGKDWTAVLFAYYDFRADKIIVQDEIIFDFKIPGNDIEKLTKLIDKKEEELWTNVLTNEIKSPYLRVSDVNPIVLNEISKYSNSKINFLTTKKDDLKASINNLRTIVGSKKLIINPKCKKLISHLKNVRWNNARDGFARAADGSHYDAAAAAIYLVRNVQTTKNPYPKSFEFNQKDLFIANPSKFNSSGNYQVDIFKQIFNVPLKKKW